MKRTLTVFAILSVLSIHALAGGLHCKECPSESSACVPLQKCEVKQGQALFVDELIGGSSDSVRRIVNDENGLRLSAADMYPSVNGSIFRLYEDGAKKLLISYSFYMDEPAKVMLQTTSNKVYCKFGTLLSSSSQPYRGIQCSLYDNLNNHLKWAFNAFYPWIIAHPSENTFEDSKGRKYLIRFESTKQNQVPANSALLVFQHLLSVWMDFNFTGGINPSSSHDLMMTIKAGVFCQPKLKAGILDKLNCGALVNLSSSAKVDQY